MLVAWENDSQGKGVATKPEIQIFSGQFFEQNFSPKNKKNKTVALLTILH